MGHWCQKHHKKSGLLDQVPQGKKEDVVEQELIGIVNSFYGLKDGVIIAGNSIAQDRKFIDKYMPNLASRLHYRMLDVSSFKIIFEYCYRKKFHKKQTHRALADIEESIDELKYYLNFLDRNRLVDLENVKVGQ
jgi:oligoribonuclease